MYQLEKMSFRRFLLNILKLNFPTYDWFCADGSHNVQTYCLLDVMHLVFH